MAVVVAPEPFRPLSATESTTLAGLPTAVLADTMNRAGGMDGGMRHIAGPAAMLGAALTVSVMVGDNSALHHAAALVEPGAIIVCDGHGDLSTALWGEILHAVAVRRGAAGLIIDGCVRDVDALQAMAIPVWARGHNPVGPHKGWGGSVNAPIVCGGCVVQPGDIIVSDQDGIVVVPRDTALAVATAARTQVVREAEILQAVAEGRSTVEIFGLTRT